MPLEVLVFPRRNLRVFDSLQGNARRATASEGAAEPGTTDGFSLRSGSESCLLNHPSVEVQTGAPVFPNEGIESGIGVKGTESGELAV